MRERLNVNDLIRLKSFDSIKEYYITSVQGEGASCIVYDAIYIDDIGIARNVRIKELFPIKSCLENRLEKNVIWLNSNQQKEDYINFERVYKRHIYFQNMLGITNSSSHIIDELYDCNGTKYIVIDCSEGVTFNKYETTSLLKVLKIILSLTKVVKKFHDNGYLMLDIKPENFLTLPETDELVKYLDFDSIIAKQSLITGKLADISYTSSWAAPELVNGKISKISNSSDIYSIASILYSKIFGESPDAKIRGIGFEPNYSNNIFFKRINPKVKQLLTNIFKQTLTSNPLRRIQNCDELIDLLEDVIKLADPDALYLLSSQIDQKNVFIGRNKEIKLIQNAFLEGKSRVYLNGVGGIGKTEISKHFAIINNLEFNLVIWGKCITGLKDLINDDHVFHIANYHKPIKSTVDDKIRLLKELVTQNDLIIIDNLDVFNDPYYPVLLELDCKLLITTRANLTGIVQTNTINEIISVDVMNMDDSVKLFNFYYTKKNNDSEKEQIVQIIEYLGGFSLAIPIIAKQLMLQDISPFKMLEMLNANKLKGVSNTLVKHYKDNNFIMDNAYNHMLNLFNVAQLSADEKSVLYVMSLLGHIQISKRTLAVFCGLGLTSYKINNEYRNVQDNIAYLTEFAEVEVINRLIDKGYLEYNIYDDYVSCHNIIREIALYEFGYSINDVSFFKQILDVALINLRHKFYEDNNIILPYAYEDINYATLIDTFMYNLYDQIYYNVLNNLSLEISENFAFVYDTIKIYIAISNYELSELVYKINKFYNLETNCYIESMQLDILIAAKQTQFIKFPLDTYKEERKRKADKLTCLLEKYNKFSDTDINCYKIIEIFCREFSFCADWIDIVEDPRLIEQVLILYQNWKIAYDNYELYLKSIYHDSYWKYMDDVLDPEEYIDDIKDKYTNFGNKEKSLNSLEKESGVVENIAEQTNNFICTDDEDVNLNNIYSTLFYQLLDPNMPKYKKDELSGLTRSRNRFRYDRDNLYFNEQINFEIADLFPTKDDIENARFISCLGIGSDYYDLNCDNSNDNSYEYMARGNDFMFMTNVIYMVKLYRQVKFYSQSSFFTFDYRLGFPEMLEKFNQPLLLLEIIRAICTNLQKGNDNDEYSFYAYHEDVNLSSFYNYCENKAVKYKDKKLLSVIYQSKKEYTNLNFTYDKVFFDGEYDTEEIWNAIIAFYEKVCVATEDEYFIIKKDLLNSNIPAFYIDKLLNCYMPRITMFDAMDDSIDGNLNIRFQANIDYLEMCLNRENEINGRLEKLLNLCEIAFQYALLDDFDRHQKYMAKIITYMENCITYEGVFDYLIFNAILMYLFALMNTEKLYYVNFDLMYYLLVVWLDKYIDTLNYYQVELIRNRTTILYNYISDTISSTEDLFEENIVNAILSAKERFVNRVDFVDRTFIGEEHLKMHGDRLDGVYTEERAIEYVSKCDAFIQQNKASNLTKVDFQNEYKKIFDEVFPFPEDWSDDYLLPLHEFMKKKVKESFTQMLKGSLKIEKEEETE